MVFGKVILLGRAVFGITTSKSPLVKENRLMFRSSTALLTSGRPFAVPLTSI
ncbi:hypothetical protein D3C79_931440 [compost metagenome]